MTALAQQPRWEQNTPSQCISHLAALAETFPSQSANSALDLAHLTSVLPPPVPPASSLKFSHPLLADATQRDKLAVLDLLFKASIK